MKRVIIVHGWADDPTRGWMGWLSHQLTSEGIEVAAPQFPRAPLFETDVPALIAQLSRTIGVLGRNDVIVAHSLGVPLTLRVLSDYSGSETAAGLVTVAGVADYPLMRPNALFDPPLDFTKIVGMMRHRVSIYSDNDRSIPQKITDHLAEVLRAEQRLDPGKGHFAGQQGLTELPSVLEAVKSCLDRNR